VIAPVIALTALDRFPLWAAIVIVARELSISLLRVVLGLRGRALPASRGAKVKTTLQLLAITLYILPGEAGSARVKLAVLVVAVTFTVLTGLQYAVAAAPWLRRTGGAPAGGRDRS
jgi:CDP-diacylglycerol--glycerol-3-phosphate 3-phosphatidyltransferase